MGARRAMVWVVGVLVVILGGWADRAHAAEGLFEDQAAPAAGGAVVGAPAAGTDVLAREVLDKANAACFSLTNEYIVTAGGTYLVEEDGEARGNVSVLWEPYNGVRVKYNGKLEKLPLATADVEMLAKVAWTEALFPDFSFTRQTAVRTADGFVVTDKREGASAVSTINGEYFRCASRLLGPDQKPFMEMTHTAQKADGKFYCKEFGLLVNESGLRCQYSLTYTHQDGVVILKRINMTLKSEGPRMTVDGQLRLTLDKAQIMKIANTGKGLMQDRVDAFVALTVSMDLKRPEKDKRLGAAQVLGKVGVQSLPYLALLENVAKSDADAEVRQAATATVAALQRLQAGGAPTPAAAAAVQPPGGTGANPAVPGGGAAQGGVVPPANTDATRFVGSWRGPFTLNGVGHVESVQFLADGGVRSVLVNQWNMVVWNRRGTYTADNGVLTINYPGERTNPVQYKWDGDRQFTITVGPLVVTYSKTEP